MKNTDEMEVTTIHESGMSVPMYKAVSVVIEHPSGLTLTITETEEGLKVTETPCTSSPANAENNTMQWKE